MLRSFLWTYVCMYVYSYIEFIYNWNEKRSQQIWHSIDTIGNKLFKTANYSKNTFVVLDIIDHAHYWQSDQNIVL